MSTLRSRNIQPSQVRGVNREKRTVDIVASDFTIDSYGTRIDPAGWDLEQFRKNPVICLQHDSWRGLPVAAAIPESIRVNDAGQLVMTPQFPPAGTTVDSDESFGLIDAGILRGVSVGFQPIEWEDKEEEVDGYKRMVRIYRKQKLLEVSFVTIPANDNGLVSRSREMNADPEAMKKLTESLESRMTEDKEETEAREKIGAYRATHLVKCITYFENKQPANRASTKVLEKFFKARGEEAPAEEVKAWERMAELLDETPEVKPEEKVEEKPVEVIEPEEKKEETPPEAVPTEPTPAEAPQVPEQKASASIPLSVLKTLPKAILDAAEESAAKASRKGIPANRLWDEVQKDLGTLISSLSHPQQ